MTNPSLTQTPRYTSVIPLIIANFVSLIGVIFFEWNLFHVLFLYWLESAVIGFYSILKLIKISGLLSILVVPFFIVHYGGFMTGHLVFLLAFFAPELVSSSFFPSCETIGQLLHNVAVPLAALFVSHGTSFIHNFIGKREYEQTDAEKQMHAPYKRIILMHITIILGGWLVLLLNAPVFGLVILVLLKTVADMRAHLKEHARLQE